MLTNSKQEISRLAQNNKILFDLLPDMLFIIKDNFVIEHMNVAAVAKFGNQNGRKCYEITAGRESPCETGMCLFHCRNPKQYYGKVFERKLHDTFYMEYCYVPFEGYRHDKLTLLIIRDVTEKKLHALKLEEYRKNIEEILKKKIAIIKAKEIEREQLYQEVNYFKKEMERFVGRGKMIGESKPIHALREMIYQVAPSDATILITGESGTGKELVADLIHEHSSRADKCYLKFNCAAVAESLLESDLFGYEKGAFTGATERRIGKFEEADTGTVFLDEIGDISPKMQASLLRVLQEGEILRIGSNTPIPVDVRVIAATNTDLTAAVEAGKFRRDLYYRLNVINLHMVPLRERKEDIVLLAMNFLMTYRERFNKEVNFLPTSVVEILLEYHWPGNVRELENTIQRAVLLSKNGMISPTLMDFLNEKQGQSQTDSTFSMKKFLDFPLKDSVSIFETELISAAIRECGGNMDNVAGRLGMSKSTLYEKLKRYGINPKQAKNNG